MMVMLVLDSGLLISWHNTEDQKAAVNERCITFFLVGRFIEGTPPSVQPKVYGTRLTPL